MVYADPASKRGGLDWDSQPPQRWGGAEDTSLASREGRQRQAPGTVKDITCPWTRERVTEHPACSSSSRQTGGAGHRSEKGGQEQPNAAEALGGTPGQAAAFMEKQRHPEAHQ